MSDKLSAECPSPGEEEQRNSRQFLSPPRFHVSRSASPSPIRDRLSIATPKFLSRSNSPSNGQKSPSPYLNHGFIGSRTTSTVTLNSLDSSIALHRSPSSLSMKAREEEQKNSNKWKKIAKIVIDHYLAEFEIFCDQTQIHGPGRMIGSKPDKIKYLLWTVITLVAIGFGTHYSIIVWNQFASSTVATSIVSTTEPLSSIEFPKTVICNHYRLRQSFLETLIANKNEDDDNNLASAVYRNYFSGYNYENEDQESFDQKLLAAELPPTKWNMTKKEFTRFIQYNGMHNPGVLEPIARGRVTRDQFTRCPMIQLDTALRSGPTHGLEMLLDAETWDNGDPAAESDGFNVLITDNDDASLVELNGFSVTPGSDVVIKLQPNLYTITESAKTRFDYKNRKCIYDAEFFLPFNIQKLSNSSEYSHATCLLAATFAEINEKCNDTDLATMVNTGRALGCINDILKNIGQYESVLPVKSDQRIDCVVKCERQVNNVVKTEHLFPNRQFARQRSFWWVMQRLFKTCNPEPDKLKGWKRSVMLRSYPRLCHFYDTYIYQNSSLNNIFQLPPDIIVKRFRNLTFADFALDTLQIGDRAYDDVLRNILQYCRENIVRLTIYLDKPYVTKFETDQTYSVASLLANIGGMLGFSNGFSIVCAIELVYIVFLSPLFKLLPWLWERETTPRPKFDELTLEYKAAMSPGLPARSISKGDLLPNKEMKT